MCCYLGPIVSVQGFSPENVENTTQQNIVNSLDVFVITLRGSMNGK